MKLGSPYSPFLRFLQGRRHSAGDNFWSGIFPVLEIDAFCCFSWGQRMSRLPGLVRAGLHGPV